MKDIPILDEAYMERRARRAAWKHELDSMSLLFGYREPKDEATKAREAYLAGDITVEEFESRLNADLGLKP